MAVNSLFSDGFSGNCSPGIGSLGLYVHFPWCEKKCPYCDFNSHGLKSSLPERDYIQALIRDLDQHQALLDQRRVSSIYLGGGTPSLFSALSLEHLFKHLHARGNMAEELEVTMEANPGTVNAESLRAYRELGINRLSIGVQSFSDDKLQALGRIHNRDQAKSAVCWAGDAGFENINIDLMFGLPGQTEQQALQDIEIALGLDPNHLSVYQLAIEPNTRFSHEPPQLPSEEEIYSMQLNIQKKISLSGYKQYEVSAYSKPGMLCSHNLNYWQFGDYLGIGAGAHSKISKNEAVFRFMKEKHPLNYMRLSGQSDINRGSKRLSRNDLITEFMLNALRLNAGFSQSIFEQNTGLNLSDCDGTLKVAREKGLLEYDGMNYYPSERGRWFLNDLIQIFMDVA